MSIQNVQMNEKANSSPADLYRPDKSIAIIVKESREAVEANYELVSISSPKTVQGLEDMGTSRASVAVYTLYNYILVSLIYT